jgi:RNA polymerase sigma-70 factor (ECF subfamily)
VIYNRADSRQPWRDLILEGLLMPTTISHSDVQLIIREATAAATRLIHRLRLPRHQHEDVRQDLLVDLLTRLKAFDPARGMLGAFAGKIVAHRANRLAQGIHRERTLFASFSLDDPLPDSEGTPLSDIISEADGYSAISGQPTDRVHELERHLDLDRALGSVREDDLALCADLIDGTPTQISRGGARPRASLYRQVREIRLRLMAAGVSAAG